MQLANQEAIRFRHQYIGTEHILLGLIREGSGVAACVLKELGIDLAKVRLEVERLVASGPDPIEMLMLPQTPRAKKVIEYALEESRYMRHAHVGTEHVLLGLLREQEGGAGLVLSTFGLSVDAVRSQVASVLTTVPERFKTGRSFLPADEPTIVQPQTTEPLPAQCPKCGADKIVHLIWPRTPYRLKRDSIKEGKAVFVSIEPPGVEYRSWACLNCSPQWSEVHELSLQDHQLQLAKEEAVSKADFNAAAARRDEQVPVRKQIWAIVTALLASQ